MAEESIFVEVAHATADEILRPPLSVRQHAALLYEVIETRARLHDRTKETALEVEGVEKISEEAIEVLERI